MGIAKMEAKVNAMVLDIWIEVEHCVSWNEADDNSDVIVTLKSGERRVASFFTYKNIATLTSKNKKTSECCNGLYFGATDMILIEKLNRETIIQTINTLIETDEFETYFSLKKG